MNNLQQPQMVPVGFGDGPALQRFIQRHRQFLAELPKLTEICNKVFDRTLPPHDENGRQALLEANLPDDDPAVVAWEDRNATGNLIFHFGLMAAGDLNAVLLLGANGAGFSAFILLRSMYERLVTAMYIAKRPSEARAFAESSPIYKLNFLTRLRELVPEVKARYDDAFMNELQQSAAASRAKRKQSICNKCGQPITNEAWTRVSLDVMAREVDPVLEEFYGPMYIEGTYQAHANILGMERRLEETERGYRYKDISENEATVALNLMLRFLKLENEHFNLNLDQAIREREAAFIAIWGDAQAGVASEASTS
jgi:Family of unknown function (DUF5677)